MTTAPYVELRFNPTDLRPLDLPTAGAFLGSPADAIEAALAVARAAMIDQMKKEAKGLSEPSQAQLLRIADLAWQGVFWRFRKVSAPIMADAYIRAYRTANAGDVPMSVIYDLADKHAEKIGDYFHVSSREALADGFNGLVNKQIARKAAADRVLDAYGLTPRQMRSYTSATTFATPVSDVLPRPVKAKARAYIDRSFTTRIRKLSKQEEHNIDEQAKQFAWMWLQDKGRLSPKAMKLWITAKDERVCPVCGPLHGQKVLVSERFVTAHGEFWTPGLHPNCRCVVRLLEMKFSKDLYGDELGEFNRLHPRGGGGRFSAKARTAKPKKSTFQFTYAEPSKPVIETEVIETAPEISLAPPKEISLGRGEISLGRAISLGREVSLSPREVSLGGEREASLAGPKREVRMSEGEKRSFIAMNVTPAMQVQMNAALATVIELDQEKFVPAKPPPLKTFFRPTLIIQNENAKRYPIYAVHGPMDASWAQHGEFVSLDRGTVFSPRQSQILAKAARVFEDNIVQVSNHVIYEGDHVLRYETGPPSDQTVWRATLEEEDVLAICTWMAYQGRVQDPDWAGGDPMHEVAWVGPGGEEWIQEYHNSQLADMMHLKPSDFEVRILRLDEGHDSNLGRTRQITSGSKFGMEEWETEGDYFATDVTPENVSHNLQLKTYHLEPDIEEIEIESPFD